MVERLRNWSGLLPESIRCSKNGNSAGKRLRYGLHQEWRGSVLSKEVSSGRLMARWSRFLDGKSIPPSRPISSEKGLTFELTRAARFGR